MATMRLHELLKQVGIAPTGDNPAISGIAMNSRHVRPGDLFVALGGGHAHLDKAVAAGAVAVLSDVVDTASSVPVVYCEGATQRLDAVLGAFYATGFSGLNLFAVTGTNGKTSCAHFLAQSLGVSDRCGMIGTLGYGELNHISYTGYTTPDVCEMYRILSHFEAEGIKQVVMEVSSHALEQGRVKGLAFLGAIFTNLSQDHLDYHKTMDAYFAAKQRLFTEYAPGFSVINSDDVYGRELLASLSTEQHYVVYGQGMQAANGEYVLASGVDETRDGLRFDLRSSWGDFQINSQLFGQYNVYNMLAVAAVLFKLGYEAADVAQRLQAIRPVHGRLEDFQAPGRPRVFVDFAHTPDALQQTLSALRNSFASDIYCVFGCGGERDQGKRPLMGAVASQLCKRIIITDDNPRSEDPGAIVEDILRGIERDVPHIVEHDRRKAIQMAIHAAGETDVVLIAGKGHETTQTIGQQVLPFSDAQVVQEVLAA